MEASTIRPRCADDFVQRAGWGGHARSCASKEVARLIARNLPFVRGCNWPGTACRDRQVRIDAMGHMRITSDSEVAAPTHGRLTGSQANSAGEDPVPRQRSWAEREFLSDPAPTRLPQATSRWQWRIQRNSRERRPLALALLLSLLVHALLLSLTFGDEELGLPGLALPWRERRIEVPDLRVVLVPAHIAPAEPAVVSVAKLSPKLPIDPPRSGAPVPALSVSAALDPQGTAATNAPATKPPAQADATRSEVAGAASTEAAPSTEALIRAQRPDRLLPVRIPEPAAIDVKPSDGPWSVVRTESLSPVSVIAAAPSASSVQTVPSASPDPGYVAQEAQREEAVRQEAARVEAVRLEAERQETARQAAVQLEAQRQETARQEAARVEIARLEAERQETARQTAAQLEAQRQEAARQEAARVEIARLEAERQETARQAAAQLEAQRQDAARQEAARVEVAPREAERQETARPAAQLEAQRQDAADQEAARVQPVRPEAARLATSPQEVPHVEVEQDGAARREAALRAIGRQLDEEAARRQAASTAAHLPNTLPYSLSTARRVRLWGRTDPNVELVQYAEAWARKIQLNTVVETIREVVKRPHTPSMVTVAVRSDGSVESVTFVVSSGVAEIDEAIRRIVESHRPYPAFPPALSRDFDVIEIRRTWYFDSGVRLQ